MGTYPELPSYVLETGEDLQDVLDQNVDELIGQKVAGKFKHSKIPYLPKVLSIAKALPLQLHPVRHLIATPSQLLMRAE
jgi:mannose-6-phosphate isomerase